MADRCLERFLLGSVKRYLNNPFHAFGANDDRHADIETFHAVLPAQVCSARENAFLVAEVDSAMAIADEAGA